MAMRLSGLMSGMDTESIIQQLVEVRGKKVETAKKDKTKFEWKQDAWKSLNTKIKNFQSKYVNVMRFSDAYSKKTTKVSNSSAVSVITGENAVNGVQTLKVKQLAKTGYLTGAQLQGSGDYTALTKLGDITTGTTSDGTDVKFSGSGTFVVKAGTKEVSVTADENTTISDVLTQLKNAGLNANFDAKNQRFFVSSKESGVENDFSLTASDAGGAKLLSALGLQVGLDQDAASKARYEQLANNYVAGDRSATLANMSAAINKATQDSVNKYLSQYKTAQTSLKAANDKIAEIEDKYSGDNRLEKSAADYKTDLDAKKAEIKDVEDRIKAETDPAEKTRLEEQLSTLREEETKLTEKQSDAAALESAQASVETLNAQISDIENYINVTPETGEDGEVTYTATASATLTNQIEDSYYNQAAFANEVVNGGYALGTNAATKVSGQDAEIELNGATFTNGSNVFEINGLTFTALSETAENEVVTVTTQNDTDGIYDMVKNFFKEYNSIINEMDKMYNADSAKGFEPLSSEEKDSMSETEIKEYEQKIKDAVLRRDENLGSISNALKTTMMGGIEVGDKKMYLSDFGINLMSYFTAPDNQKNAYHIDGDPDDPDTSGNADVLKGLIASDPDTVVEFFSKLSQSLYTEMNNQSKSVDGYRSFGSFYDDKKMKTDLADYTSRITDLEQKLNDYEDKWYAKFAAMETAMAKMQSKTNAIAGLFGGN